jgi:two-component system nitrogen regulation sensor histidine kinase NtrY
MRAFVRDLSLNAKVTLTLTAVFASIVAAFLVFLVPFLREQRESLVEKDERLLSTLRDAYAREFIYDLISENEDSLAAHLGELAGQRGLVWARVESEGRDVAATTDRATIREVLGESAGAFDGEPTLLLLVRGDGGADLVASGGRPLLSTRTIDRRALPVWPAPHARAFREVDDGGRRFLHFASELRAADDRFGRLSMLYSLADLQRTQALTHTLFYGLAGTSFVLVLFLLNLLMSRMVIGPVKSVQQAMTRAATGDLEGRLPVHSKDELGTMADAFNRMVGELDASKREVEGYSRNLEGMVETRTRALRESEADLRDLKNRLATVIATVATGVISLDEAGRIETFNERAAEILGVTGDVQGRTLGEVLQGDSRQILDLVEAVRRERASREEAQLVCQLPRGRRTLSVVASTLPAAGEAPGTVVVCEDLTEIIATQRLSAWKEAVERVIHEIKNPLTPVGLAAETLKTAHAHDRTRFDALFPAAIDMVLSSVRSLKDLIADFSRFSRLPTARPERCATNELVRDSLEGYTHLLGGGPRVRLDLADEVPPIEADPEQMKRVLLNVVNNGLEAMERGSGEVVVATRHEDGEVVISVADEGAGIEDVARVFEPYYTTKPKGTGLGLVIARQIVEDHRGRLVLDSRLGRGTTVRIRLPAARVD